MAKESPWFKFFTGEWANGSITLENYAVQGVFINACCFYWSKQGDVTRKQLEKKIRSNKELDVLFEEEILKTDGQYIIIDFLDNQMVERQEKSKQASEAGKKSAAKRAEKHQRESNARSTPVEISFNENPTNKNKSKNKKENKSKKENNKEAIVYFPNDILLNEKYIEFLNFRKESKKPVLKSSLEANKKKLMKMAAENPNTAIEIIDQSIANGWQGFFELKTNNNGGQQRNNQGTKVGSINIPNDYNPEVF